MNFEIDDAIRWFTKANDKIQQQISYLTKLDQAIGDGDHGENMAIGFESVVTKLQKDSFYSVAEVVHCAAIEIMASVGGASGSLYGTALLKMASYLKNKPDIDVHTFAKSLENALQGMKQIGNVGEGEKTLIDVWAAVVILFLQANEFPTDELIITARNAMEGTKKLVATKGKASLYKDESIGHLDPGSVSSYYIFEALAEALQEV